MGFIVSEIRDVVSQIGIEAEELSDVRLRGVLELVRERFIGRLRGGALWEGFRENVSVQDPVAWQWISTVPVSGRAILFFEDGERFAGFAFESATDVVSVLAESTGFEFYLTDEDVSFVLAFNHHDYISAAGGAADWLAALIHAKGGDMS
jgi:hypothetical protein